VHDLWLITPIILVLGVALYFIWAFKKRSQQYQTKKEIMKSGDRGEYKVQAVLRALQKPNSRYQIYHNIKLGPDPEHTNEYDTVIVGPNGIFHIETKNYGGERGGIIDIDSRQNWILHKKSGYSKIIANPIGQVDSHEYRLKGFLNKVVGVRNLPTQGIIVLSCDHIKLRVNKDIDSSIPILTRHELVPYIRSYRQGKVTLYPRTIKKICQRIEDMNPAAQAR
jgi:hypothetical protein